MAPSLTSTPGFLRRVVRYSPQHRYPQRQFGVAHAPPAAGAPLEYQSGGAPYQQASPCGDGRVDQGPRHIVSRQGFLLHDGLRNRHAVGERPVAEVLDPLDEQLSVSIRRQGRLPGLVATESYLQAWPAASVDDRPRVEPFCERLRAGLPAGTAPHLAQHLLRND